MLHVQSFTFNPFQENTYIVHNGSHAILIDPGCYNEQEEDQLSDYLLNNGLTPIHCINTHAHLDHIFGNAWTFRRYGLKPWLHRADLSLLQGAPNMAKMYGLSFEESPDPEQFMEDGDTFTIGNEALRVLFVPGHAPGHIALYSETNGFVIAGDVLFKRSIGRTDLPGGDMNTLLDSIRTKLFNLPADTVVYCGHGPNTSIGEEMEQNPFLIG